eukprot:2133153-Pleurochrysis_carterae.AAC.1
MQREPLLTARGLRVRGCRSRFCVCQVAGLNFAGLGRGAHREGTKGCKKRGETDAEAELARYCGKWGKLKGEREADLQNAKRLVLITYTVAGFIRLICTSAAGS